MAKYVSLVVFVCFLFTTTGYSGYWEISSTVTVTNPFPDSGDQFGDTVTALDAEHFIVSSLLDDTGATNAGTAYLYDASGVLQHVITNPIPELNDNFSSRVLPLDSGNFLISAYMDNGGQGAVYVYDTNAALSLVITNSVVSSERFGSSLAAFSSTSIVIGAYYNGEESTECGRVYIYNNMGIKQRTIINPETNSVSAYKNYFGVDVAIVGDQTLLVGAENFATWGAAYRFEEGGAFIGMITNPVERMFDNFGHAVAGVGSSNLVVGAYRSYKAGSMAGFVSLFDLDGNVIGTLYDPTPANYELFGYDVQGFRDDVFLVGAPGDSEGRGAVYLYDLNTNMLLKITSPDADAYDYFGVSVSVLDSNTIVVGSVEEDIGAPNTGAAYVFDINYSDVNRPPVVDDVSIMVQMNTIYTSQFTAVDLDGDSFIFGSGTNASYGIVQVETNGIYSYMPTNDYYGMDQFAYITEDSQGGVSTGIVSVIVNAPPVPTNVTITITEDEVLEGVLTASDADGSNISFSKNSDPSNGWVSVDGEGGYIYTPFADFYGGDSFLFCASDNRGGMGTGRVDIVIADWRQQPTIDEDFETGLLSSEWSIYSSAEGRIEITGLYNPFGNYHLVMDDQLSNLTNSLNELILTWDFNGMSNLVLTFQHKSFYDEDHLMPDAFSGHRNYDGVAISADGGTTWYKAQGLTSTEGTDQDYTSFSVMLDDIMQSYSLSYSTNYMIKFQQYDDSPVMEDGFAFDNISISATNQQQADIAVSISAMSDAAEVSNDCSYTICVWNEGPDPARGVAVINQLDTNVAFRTLSAEGHYQSANHQVHFALETLGHNETVEVAVVVCPLFTGAATNSVVVSENMTDPNPNNNSATSIVTIVEKTSGDADISVTVADNPDPVSISNELTYAVTIANNGSAAAMNVIALNRFPEGLVYVSSTRDGTVYDGLSVFAIDCVDPGSNVTWDVVFRPQERGIIWSQWEASTGTIETNMDNNIFSNSTFVTMNIDWERVYSAVVADNYVVAYAGGSVFRRPALADIDGDGDVDILSADYHDGSPNGVVQVIENVGTAVSASWSVSDPNDWILTGDMETKVVPCDIDNDGDYDFFRGDYGGVVLFSNTGTVYNLQVGNSVSIYNHVGAANDPAVCDIDGDNDFDLFVGGSGSALKFIENTGSVTQSVWASSVDYYSGVLPVTTPVFVDLDGDNDYDLFCGNIYYENTGSVTQAVWATAVTNYGGELSGTDPWFADIDNDADLDRIACNANGTIILQENTGSVTNPVWDVSIPDYIAIDVLKYSSIEFCDIDGDDDVDLFFGTSLGTITFYENEGDPVIARWKACVTNYAGISFTGSIRPVFCDIDADNDFDLFIGDQQGDVTFYENEGSRTNASWGAPAYNYANVAVSMYNAPEFFDIDGDSDYDLFVGKQLTGIKFVENTGTVTEAAWADPVNDYGGMYLRSREFTFVDLDGDGDADCMSGETDGTLRFYENTGTVYSASWTPVITNFAGIQTYLEDAAPTFCDIDADGDPDLFCGDKFGGISFWRNEGETMDVTPVSRTVEQESIIDFDLNSSVGGTPEWDFVLCSSGGSIDSNTGYYTAGTNDGLDIIEVTCSDGEKGRAFVNVIPPVSGSGTEKAIIIAGRNVENPFDPVWQATDYLADLAYNTLRYKGYSKTDILYLNPVVEQDVDGNGVVTDDIYGASTFSNAQYAFTVWATNAEELLVYMVDHGSDVDGGYMRLNPSEVLSASNVSLWLNQLQNTSDMDVAVFLEFCYAGTFLEPLAYTGAAERIVITAASDDEPTFFISRGLVSFSEAFYNALLQGFDVGTAFTLAGQAMSDYQHAWLDDNKDGVYDKELDGIVAAALKPGVSAVVGRDIPQIATVKGMQVLDGDISAELWADGVSAPNAIERVWCVVVPPDHNPDSDNPIVDLPEVDLSYVDGRYEGVSEGFTEAGTYKLIYYVSDTLGGVSYPRYGYVNQGGVDEKVILVAGGATNSTVWPTINAMAENANTTLKARQINATNIYYLNADMTQTDVDAIPSANVLINAVTNWANDAKKLTVYLIGESTNIAGVGVTNLYYILNDGEYLGVADLDVWLDTCSDSNRSEIVVMDFAGSGSWVTNLIPPLGRERVTLAAAGEDDICVWEEAGAWISFSRIFLSYIYRGCSIGEAFSEARDYTFNLAHAAQDPEMDDNDNGCVNEKSEGFRADGWYIGSAFVTGAEAPVVGNVSPDVLLVGSNTVSLWASDIVSEAILSNVWCVITSPEYDGSSTLESVDLSWDSEDERYEYLSTNFVEAGVYYCTFFAMDADGVISAPKQMEVLSADAYEPDNSSGNASAYNVGSFQKHNFHQGSDEDWVRCFMSSNWVYEVRTVQLGTNVDTVIEIYYEAGDGSLTKVYTRDSNGKGRGEGEYALMDYWPSGMYCVRALPYDESGTGISSEYEMQIYIPDAPMGVLIVIAADMMNVEASPTGAIVVVEGFGSAGFVNGANSLAMSGLPVGWWTVRIDPPTGYIKSEDPDQSGQILSPTNVFYGNPKTVYMPPGGCAYAIFVFDPVIQVQGRIRNQWSEECVEGAYLLFEPLSVLPSDWALRYDGYPAYAAYKTRWQTQSDGYFPTNVFLPPIDWRLSIHLDGYATSVWENVISNPMAGMITNLQTVYLNPLDNQNTNGLADRWENIMFGGPITDGASDDSDGDGMSNWKEYLTGTNPNNGDDVFTCTTNAMGAEGYTISWSVATGHAYRIVLCDHLMTGNWEIVWGPWTNTSGLSQQQWIDTNVIDHASCNYRVEESRP